MYRKYAIAAFAGIMLSATATAAAAQQSYCTDRVSALKRLSSEYSEAPIAMGLANNGGVIEVLADSAGKTWTILITSPRGQTCLVAAGEAWEALPIVALGSES